MARPQVQIERSIRNRISARDPSLDVEKFDIADVFVIPEAGEIAELEQRMDSIGFRYSFEYVKTQDRNVQELYGANYGLRPAQGTPATCRGVAFRYSRPVEDITITAGRQVTTTDGSITFQTAYDVTMFASRADGYYNSTTRRYEVPVQLVSVGVGLAFELPPLALRVLKDTSLGIDGIVNTTRALESSPQEDMIQFGTRVQTTFNGLDGSSASGIQALLRNYAPTVIRNVVPIFSTDVPYFQRYVRRAAWDVYIRGEQITDIETTIVAAGESSWLLTNVPVLSVSEVRINGLVTDFTFVPDTDTRTMMSSISNDRIALSFTPAVGSVITVKYQYNSIIQQLQTYVNERRNRPYRTDILIRACQPVLLRIVLNIQPSSVFDEAEVIAAVRDSAYAYFDQPQSREIVWPEKFREYLVNTVTGIRNIYVRIFSVAATGDLDVQPIDLAPYQYVTTTDVLFVINRV